MTGAHMGDRTKGRFAVARQIWASDEFKREAFTEREAFMWMISEACYEAETRQGRQLERGQFCHSFRYLAGRWGWKTSRVQRFIQRLKDRYTIDTLSDTGRLVVTICNYDKFQFTDTPADTPMVQKPIQNKKRINNNISPLTPLIEIAGEEAAQSFADHRKRMKKPLSLIASKRIAKVLAEIVDRGGNAADALGLAEERGWQGIKADWYFKEQENEKPKPPHGGGGFLEAFLGEEGRAQALDQGPDCDPSQPLGDLPGRPEDSEGTGGRLGGRPAGSNANPDRSWYLDVSADTGTPAGSCDDTATGAEIYTFPATGTG